MPEADAKMYEDLQLANLELKEKLRQKELAVSQVRQFMNEVEDLFEKIREAL